MRQTLFLVKAFGWQMLVIQQVNQCNQLINVRFLTLFMHDIYNSNFPTYIYSKSQAHVACLSACYLSINYTEYNEPIFSILNT